MTGTRMSGTTPTPSMSRSPSGVSGRPVGNWSDRAPGMVYWARPTSPHSPAAGAWPRPIARPPCDMAWANPSHALAQFGPTSTATGPSNWKGAGSRRAGTPRASKGPAVSFEGPGRFAVVEPLGEDERLVEEVSGEIRRQTAVAAAVVAHVDDQGRNFGVDQLGP